MSRNVDGSGQPDVFNSGLDALRRSPEFRCPSDPSGDHEHSNGHLALIYESREEQFGAVAPFVRQGLERGEQCLYIAAENSREEVLEELREAGIDADRALESGALIVLSVHETYLNGGSFDLDESLALLGAVAEEATADFEGVRVTAEETWLLEADAATEEFVELEARVNELLRRSDCLALCQYDRERFPAEILHDVIKTHPYLVVDNTISQNVYYTPPETFFGSEDPAEKVDRMVRTLRERTEAKTRLGEHEEYLRELYEVTANGDLSFEQTVERLLELGCERFDLRGGALAHLPTWESNFRAEVTVGPDMGDLEGELPVQPTEGCFCRQAITWDEPTAVPDVAEAGWDDDVVYREFGFATYFGIRVTAGAEPYGTFWFYDTSPREEPFSDDERTFLELMGQWVSNELERREREQFLRTSYAITSNPDCSFEEKVEQLLEHGRKWFGFDIGYFTAVDADTNGFEIVGAVGSHEQVHAGVTGTLSETYCQKVVDADRPLCVVDAKAEGWEGDPAYDTYGLDAFFGTTLEVDGDLYGTLCFGAQSPREREFTDAEYTFLELMSQWVSNELARRQHERAQRQLYEITADGELSFDEKLARLLDLGRDQFGLETGFVLERRGEEFAVVETRGIDPEEGGGPRSPRLDRYCDRTVAADVPIGVEDTDAVGWDDDLPDGEYDPGCFLGVRVTDGTGVYGSVCFVDTSVRKRSFTDAEYTFLDLMGQWVSYELERQRREAQLQQSKDQLERIFESSHDAIYIADPHADEILDVNAAACEMLGYTREELLSCAPSTIHPEEIDRFREFVDDVYDDGSGWTDELHCRRRNGHRIPAEVSASRIEYDDRQCLVAIVRDISERKQRERSQRRLYEIAADPDRSFEEKLQAVFDLGCEHFDMEIGGMASVDPETDRFEVNVMNGEHEHLTPGEPYPLSETYCRAPSKDGSTCTITDPISEGYEGKLCYERFGVRTYLGTYLEFDGTDDRTFWFVSTESREEFSETERTFFHLMGQWVKYEFERQRYERDLEKTIAQLQRSNDRLKQFAYAASHDLQEPLRMVSSYLQLLDDRYADDLNDEAREFIDFAVDGADRMREMVDDLLAFSRVEHADNEFRPVDCEDVLERVADDLQLQIEENDAELVVDPLPTVVGDREQLEQLFHNLVSNAIKYNDDSPRVEITAERTADRWEFAVSDDGIGIEPDRTDQIFEVFKRLHNRDEYSGTGIGLSLCQKTVENHGGDIWVESEPGEGSTFFFTIPRRPSN